MPTDATLTSKGQTTIPKEIREGLGMKPGDRMTFTLMPDGTVVMRVKSKSVIELAGMLHKKGRKVIPTGQLSM
ncbi:MAG: type II toxin-antitoxin system PrlF family antitoxin [Sulfuritalea sp.]|nr:type II toxin-antitoxin system PrlF family antitoxin [Sulfuritalea sp.]